MWYKIYSLDIELIGGTFADDATEAWELAHKEFGINVGDVRALGEPVPLRAWQHEHGKKKGKELYEAQFKPEEEEVVPKGIMSTVILPPTTQQAIADLLRISIGKKVEYQLQLVLEDNILKPGLVTRGSPERTRVLEGVASFHTHPGAFILELSKVDIVTLLVSSTKIVGVGIPGIYNVRFATQIKHLSTRMRKTLIETLPFIDQEVELTGLEEFCHFYDFTLGISDIVMEIII